MKRHPLTAQAAGNVPCISPVSYTHLDVYKRQVVDMQNDFVTGSLGTKEAQAIVENVVCKIKETPAEQIYVTQDLSLIHISLWFFSLPE